MTADARGSKSADWLESLEIEFARLRVATGELVNAAIQARAHVSARRSRFDAGGDAESAAAAERTLHDLDCAIAAAQEIL